LAVLWTSWSGSFYHVLAKGTSYRDPGPDYYDRRHARRVTRRAIELLERQDFLWFMSSDLFLTPQLLPRHRRQVILLVIRNLALPHHKDDFQPLRA
jgi:hypothetical protein